MRARVLAPDATDTEFEYIANDLAEPVGYATQSTRYCTAAEMAGFLLVLYDSNKIVGEMDFSTFRIKLCDPKHSRFG